MMIKTFSVLMLAGLLLSGCTTKNQQKSLVTPSPVAQQNAAPAPATPESQRSQPFTDATPPAEPAVDSNQARIQQCRKELDAMRLYSKASYDKYQAEFQAIANKTSKYLQIKDSISPDINDVAMPGYQFQIREVCFRVKNRLSQLIIRQVQ